MTSKKTTEQCAPHERGGYHRWLKKHARRIMRMWRKRDPENATTKHKYRGYET